MPPVHTIGILHQTLRELCIDLNYLMILNFKEVERHALCARLWPNNLLFVEILMWYVHIIYQAC